MIDVAHWRSLGLEIAFDPAAPDPRLTALGRAQLADELANLDAEQLVTLFPRGRDGRWPLDEHVLLTMLEIAPPLRNPKACWLAVASPKRRGDAQVLTLGLVDEIDRNFDHRWDDARWLWDRRVEASEAERWGVDGLPIELLAPARRAEAQRELERDRSTPGRRAALAIVYVRDGRWRDALALYGIRCELDLADHELRDRWQQTLDERMTDVAPWLVPRAITAMERRQRECKLFNLPGETTAKRHCVMLVRADPPQLALGFTGSTLRASALHWRWPPDLARVVRGDTARVVPRKLSGARTSSEHELLAQIAAHPGDLELRRVYADMLAESSDERMRARGEFIALQLAERALDGNAAKRMRELERVYGRDWLGPLGRAVDAVTYERGFVATARLGNARTPFDAWGAITQPRSVAELSCARVLELADQVPPATARALLAQPLPALERLVIGPPLLDSVERKLAVLEVRVFESAIVGGILERFAFALSPVLRLALADALYAEDVLARCLAQLARVPPAIERLAVTSSRFDVTLRRDDAHRLSIVEVTASPRARARLLRALALALVECPNDAITRVHVHGPLGAYERAQLDLVVSRFDRAALVIDDVEPAQ
ncbi:MAG TPA: TIGR02996 domain-containing protein [Kofleriaceae bacterium]|nr:TIGR02996 domain-containing protein [Kofleriaceae bacterium]